jgi:hypothetical protein
MLCWAIALGVFCWAAESHGQIEYVQPVDWTRYAANMGVRPGDAFGQTLATVLQNESRYELNWVNSDQQIANNLPGWEGVEYYCPKFSTYGYEQAVRPLASFAYAMAAMLKTGIYSPHVAGLSNADAIHRVELAIRGAALTSVANTTAGENWGQGLPAAQSWEAAYWAAHTAEAAWWLWDDLGRSTKLAVAKMVEHDANALLERTVPYWADKSGKIISPGDTKAEENSWNSHLLAVAQAMMPHHPNAAMWRQKASEYQVSAYSRQSDLANTALVDGKQVKDWLSGYNVFDDGVLVNHNRVHPDYLVSDLPRYASTIDVSLAGQAIPQSMVFNAALVYHALTEVRFTPGASPYGTGMILDPGGTMYCRTADGGYRAEVYYPQGADWTTKIVDGYLNTDLNAEQLGFDTGKGFDAMGWARARIEALRALQTRPGHDGNIYQPGDWTARYRGQDEVIFQSNGQAWLQWWLMQNNLMSPVSDRWGAVREPSSASETR